MAQPLMMPAWTGVPRLFVVADAAAQRSALSEVVQSCGYELIECLAPSQLQPHHVLTSPHLWLLDVHDEDEVLDRIGHDAPVIWGLEPAPMKSESNAYRDWSRTLARKLTKLLGDAPPLLTEFLDPDAPLSTPVQDDMAALYAPPPWTHVCILAASMGGPKAVKAFLDALPYNLPVAFILVQHIDPQMQALLPRILVRHNSFSCQLIEQEPLHLSSNTVLIAPATRVLHMSGQGKLLPVDGRWPGLYQPSINEVMRRAADAYGQKLVTIVFSGMGEDGSAAAADVVRFGGQIWAQNSESCDCASQPEHMRATGRVHFNGTPEALAAHLCRYVQARG